MPASTNSKSKSVTALRHKDKRANIPTEELRDFVAEDEKKPKIMLYPRDRWVPAVNNHGRFGRWEFIEISDPGDAANTIRTMLASQRSR